ncbi:MAG: GNAT family N-acetyltransferase [Hyphomicrobiales bacterium]|nr:GNAT family N-acetyltransferase [Hyphomicrobiales bacterium]
MPTGQSPIIPTNIDQPSEVDFSSPQGDDFDALSRDHIPVRSMTGADLEALIAIDRRATGDDRTAYYRRKQREAMHESGVRVSLVAEQDGHPVGFIMARVDFGEFGHTSPEAVMDTIGVDPGYRGRGVGQALMSQLIANLATLRVDHIRTELDWNDVGLINYLDEMGFAPAQRVVLSRNLAD